MNKQITYTSTIPSALMETLSEYASKFKLSKNKLIEDALRRYFDQIERAEYIRSYRRVNTDDEMKRMVEEGLEDYLSILENED